MIKSWKKYLLVLFALVVLVVLVVIVAVFDFRANQFERQSLQADLSEAISRYENGEINFVDFTTLATFSWDRLYVVGPYTSPKKIDSILGTFWLGSRFTPIQSSDSIALLIFTKRGHVVQYLEYPRGLGDFASADNRLGYAMEESRFIVDERGRMVWVNDR